MGCSILSCFFALKWGFGDWKCLLTWSPPWSSAGRSQSSSSAKALKHCLACWFNSCLVGSSFCNYCENQMCIFSFKNRYLSMTQMTHTSLWLCHGAFLNPFLLHIQRQRSRKLTYCLQSAAFVENRAHVHARLFPIFVVSLSLCLHTGFR